MFSLQITDEVQTEIKLTIRSICFLCKVTYVLADRERTYCTNDTRIKHLDFFRMTRRIAIAQTLDPCE